MSEHSEYIAELHRHIRAVESCADCAMHLRGIEAELAELSSDVQEMASTLALILSVLTKRPNAHADDAA